MGTTLTGTTPQDTYDSLIKVTDNGPIGASPKLLSDGLGNDSSLALSTTFTSVRSGNQLRLYRTDNGIYGSIQYLTGAGGFKFDDANGDGFTFAQGANTRLTITSTGNVGIGTSSPNGVLEVVGGTSTTNSIVLGQSDNATIASRHNIVFNIDRNNDVAGRSIDFRYGGNGYSGGTNIARFTSAGLCFGNDTAAANALDDYEEGTWTPTISFGGSSTGITYQSNGGRYTKIGRQVTVTSYILLTSKGSATGSARVEGLPFASASGVQFYPTANLSAISAITYVGMLQAYVNIGFTTIDLVETTEAGSQSAITDADFTNASQIILSATYFV